MPDTILPTGQDKGHIFHRACSLLGDSTKITTLDSQGVAPRQVALTLPGSLLEMHAPYLSPAESETLGWGNL